MNLGADARRDGEAAGHAGGEVKATSHVVARR